MKSFGLGSHAMKLEVGCHLNFTATTPTPVILMLRPRSGSEQRVGVCRDFAHLGISLCRALDLPARMVVGYLHQLEPMDLHAWFEVYTNDRWYTFDPTQAQPRGNRVAIAYGRDAADVALTTQFRPLTLTEMKVWVTPIS